MNTRDNKTKLSVIQVVIISWLGIAWLTLVPLININIKAGDFFELQQADLSELLEKESPHFVSNNTSDVEVILPKNQGDTFLSLSPDTSLADSISKKRQLPDTGGNRGDLTILLIGDSMAECLYWPFRKYCRNSNYKLYAFTWYGSSSIHWAQQDTLENWISRYRPDLVLFTVGANEILIPSLKSREKYFKRILSKLDATRYIFVGAPNWLPDQSYYPLLSSMVPSDKLFNSKDMVLERRKDGAHPTMKASEIWADSIANWIEQGSKYRLTFHDTAIISARKAPKASFMAVNLNTKAKKSGSGFGGISKKKTTDSSTN